MAFKDRPYFRRILELHDVLRRGRRVTCPSLARRWETSSKTVQRLVDQMRVEFGAPIEFDRQKQTYRYTDPGYQLPWLPVEGSDLFAIGVAMKVLQIYEGTPVAKDLKEIFKRLSALMPPEIRVHPSSLVERLWVHPQPLRLVSPEVWGAVAGAIREKTALEVVYVKPGLKGEKRVLEPYNLVLAAGDWFLLARDPGDGRVKTFYVSRIAEARAMTSRFAMPKDFDPAEYFGESIGIYRGALPFRFQVRFTREVAALVSEVRWHPAQKSRPLPDGGLVLELPSGSLEEARRFVLSFGRSARAVSPPELVEDLRRELGEMVDGYKGVPGSRPVGDST